MDPIVAPAELTFVNIAGFVQQAVAKVDECLKINGAAAGARPAVPCDLAALTVFDSAAIAGLVALERRAQARQVALNFLNVTPNLRKLASLYAVDGLLFGD